MIARDAITDIEQSIEITRAALLSNVSILPAMSGNPENNQPAAKSFIASTGPVCSGGMIRLARADPSQALMELF